MSHCCLSLDLRLLIIPLVSSSFSCKGVFCTTTENDVTSGHVTDVTSDHANGVTSGHVTSSDVTSGSTPFPNYNGLQSSKQSSTDQTPNMLPPPPPPLQYSQSNDEELYYILKTNNPFLFWEPLYCNAFHVI
jgi:hypothetical protein